VNTIIPSVSLIETRDDIVRNIVSLRQSQDLFDDLSVDAADWALAQQVESDTKPLPYQSHTPVIHRPFEEASWFDAIGWPFKNWQKSRFSDGSFGVWYGSESVETSTYESAYHWYFGFLADAGFQRENVVSERKIYRVRCEAALLDFRPVAQMCPDILHKSDYSYAQRVGARLQREGHPGLVVPSVRRAAGWNYVIFNSEVLSQPRLSCFLNYRLEGKNIRVEREPGVEWMSISVSDF